MGKELSIVPLPQGRTTKAAQKLAIGIASLAVVACGGSAEDGQSDGKGATSKIVKEANKVLMTEFETKYSKCGDKWVATWRINKDTLVLDQFFGIAPEVLEIELTQANELNGYEFKGSVFMGEDATRRRFDLNTRKCSEWRSYKPPASGSIEKKNGGWNMENIYPYTPFLRPLRIEELAQIDCSKVPSKPRFSC